MENIFPDMKSALGSLLCLCGQGELSYMRRTGIKLEVAANPPSPHGICPEPSQLHHAVSSVVAPLECYKAF